MMHKVFYSICLFLNSTKIHFGVLDLQISHTGGCLILNFFIMHLFSPSCSVSIFFSFSVTLFALLLSLCHSPLQDHTQLQVSVSFFRLSEQCLDVFIAGLWCLQEGQLRLDWSFYNKGDRFDKKNEYQSCVINWPVLPFLFPCNLLRLSSNTAACCQSQHWFLLTMTANFP